MAGAGVKVFQSGEKLTAAQVNSFLMDQVVARFADAATRDASFGGAGKPALTEGRFCYLDDVNEVQYYDGAAWQSAPQFALQDDAVTTAKIQDGAVTSAKIANGSILNVDISASAEIAKTKISGTAITAADTGTVTSAMIADGTILNADISASAAIDKTKISGTAITAADTGVVTSAMIVDGTIVNADISSSAAIALSKLASGTSAQVPVASSTGVPTYRTLTGDVTIGDTGVTAIASGAIVNADISSTAAIDKNKIADLSIDAKASGYTLVLTDKNKLIEMNVSSSHQLVIPLNSTAAFPIGTEINVLQVGTGRTTIAGVSGVTVNGTPGLNLRAQWSSATLIKRGTDTWVAIGDLSA
jgi:hypothetical protein